MGAWPQLSSREDAEVPRPPVLPVSARSVPPGGVTPHELRNLEFRETFRGYHRDEVDALCERAAETIEHFERRCRDLQERLQHALARASGSSQSGATPGSSGPESVPRLDRESQREVDVVQRTLALAQQAADEAVAEAQDRAHHLVADAESKANTLVIEAEVTARRIADGERRRVESEVAELGARRSALTADVDLLERYTSEYRDRLRRAIESELHRLEGSAVAAVLPPPTPALHDSSTPPAPALRDASVPPAPALHDPSAPTPNDETAALPGMATEGVFVLDSGLVTPRNTEDSIAEATD